MSYHGKRFLTHAKYVGLCLCGLILAIAANLDRPAQAADKNVAGNTQFFGMVKINVLDLERSITFYTTLLDLKVSEVLEIPGVTEVFLTRSGQDHEQALILVHNHDRKDPISHGDGLNNLTFVVSDLKESIKKFEETGYKFSYVRERLEFPTFYAPFLSIAFTKDPDGFDIELVQLSYE